MAVNSNFCSRTQRLATIHNVTDDDDRQTTTDGRNSVPIARPLVRSAKNQSNLVFEKVSLTTGARFRNNRH